MNKFTGLIILDGYGLNKEGENNAISAKTSPYVLDLMKKYPTTSLDASGMAVGLPDGQMGNSEVGHLNIGAGRIVYQELTRITKSINDGDFFENAAFLRAVLFWTVLLTSWFYDFFLPNSPLRKPPFSGDFFSGAFFSAFLGGGPFFRRSRASAAY